MDRVFPIRFENNHTAAAIAVSTAPELPGALWQLGLTPPRRTLVLVGGAGKMADADQDRLHQLFADVLAPLAAANQVVVVDGGTDAGVMRLAGEARMSTQPRFDLLGVAAEGTVVVPDRAPPSPDAASLEPQHSHFMMVPGTEWGAEAPWIAQVASVLAGDLPSATLLINGGEIAWQDVRESVKARRPVLVVAGSGRTADVLVGVLCGERSDERADPLIASALLRVLEPLDGVDAARQTLREVLQV